MTLTYGVYGARTLLEAEQNLRWVGEEPGVSHSSTHGWRMRDFPNVEIAASVSNLMSKLAAIKAGLGVGILPDFIAQHEPSLGLVDTRDDWALNLWFLSHSDMFNLSRIRYLREAIDATCNDWGLT